MSFDSNDDLTDLLQRAHAATQAYMWRVARSAAKAPDLGAASRLSLERVKAERRRRLVRAGLARDSRSPSTRRDVMAILRAAPSRADRMRGKEISAYSELQVAATTGRHAQVAELAQLLHDEAAGTRSPWSTLDGR